MLKRIDNLLIAATLEVGAPDTHAEEGVATESRVLFFAVVGDTTRGMAWGMEDTQSVAAKGDGIAVSEISANGWYFHRQGNAEYI